MRILDLFKKKKKQAPEPQEKIIRYAKLIKQATLIAGGKYTYEYYIQYSPYSQYLSQYETNIGSTEEEAIEFFNEFVKNKISRMVYETLKEHKEEV
jgi:hypothetical protein